MKFVAAKWIDSDTGDKLIEATGDDGSTWWVPALNSDVPPWPEFLAEHGEAAITGDPPPKVEPH